MFFPVLLLALSADTAQRSDSARVWIEGGSNIANWTCKAVKFDARVDSGRVSVRLSARDLKCGNGRMDRDLYAALKASDPASPSWIVALFDGVSATMASDTPGMLELAGVARAVNAQITTERAGDGTLMARGSVPLLMTDFGVKPPVGLFGLIRSKNRVVVKFELIVNERDIVSSDRIR